MVEYQSIYQLLKGWGRWRARSFSIPARPVTRAYTAPDWSSFKKACSLCHGKTNCEPCPACHGKGFTKVRYPVIDPALIHGPSVMRVNHESPELFIEVNAAVDGFEPIPRAVVMARYIHAPQRHNGNRLLAANRTLLANGEQPIASQYFGQVLKDCQRRISRIIGMDG